MQVQFGPEAFRFSSFQQWVDKAQSWFQTRIPEPARSRHRYVAVDATGRVCLIGADFMRARDEGTFPVVVYLIDVAASSVNALTKAAHDVLAERQRQMSAEGWTPEHDDEHTKGELAVAAALYALQGRGDPMLWITSGNRPGHNANFLGRIESWLKPADRRRNLVRATALLLAEIERLDRKLPPKDAVSASPERVLPNLQEAGGAK
jgi:hypothetical protein